MGPGWDQKLLSHAAVELTTDWAMGPGYKSDRFSQVYIKKNFQCTIVNSQV